MTDEQLIKYFRRIGYVANDTEPNINTLTALQQKHSETIPFENINPLLNIPVLLDEESLFNKIVSNSRGGYCYEQNIFFMNILKALHFNVRGLTGRVFNGGEMIKRRTHMLLLINVDGIDYVSDVGFGSLVPCSPLKLKVDVEQKTDRGTYRLHGVEDGFVLQIKLGDEWRSLYLFDLQKQYAEDFEVGNWYTSTHPSSNFRHQLMVSLKNRDRSYSLDNYMFSTYYLDGRKVKVELESKKEVVHLLEDTFGINMSNLELPSDF